MAANPREHHFRTPAKPREVVVADCSNCYQEIAIHDLTMQTQWQPRAQLANRHQRAFVTAVVLQDTDLGREWPQQLSQALRIGWRVGAAGDQNVDRGCPDPTSLKSSQYLWQNLGQSCASRRVGYDHCGLAPALCERLQGLPVKWSVESSRDHLGRSSARRRRGGTQGVHTEASQVQGDAISRKGKIDNHQVTIPS